jgi:hypothetical protein
MQMTTTLRNMAAQPDPAYRDRVKDRLKKAGRTPGRSYRGHPLAWTGLGAAAAVLVMLGLGRPEPPASPLPAPAPAPPVVAKSLPEPAPSLEPDNNPWTDTDPMLDIATHWADLHNSNHLKRAVDEEAQRKLRSEERRPLVKSAVGGPGR